MDGCQKANGCPLNPRSEASHLRWLKISCAMQWSWHWHNSSNCPLQSPLPSVRIVRRCTQLLYSANQLPQEVKHLGLISSRGSFSSSPLCKCGAWYFGKCWKKLGLYEKLMMLL